MNPAILVLLWFRLSIIHGYPAASGRSYKASNEFSPFKKVHQSFASSYSNTDEDSVSHYDIFRPFETDDNLNTAVDIGSNSEQAISSVSNDTHLIVVRVSSTSIVKPKVVTTVNRTISVSKMAPAEKELKSDAATLENIITPSVAYLRKNNLNVDENESKISVGSHSGSKMYFNTVKPLANERLTSTAGDDETTTSDKSTTVVDNVYTDSVYDDYTYEYETNKNTFDPNDQHNSNSERTMYDVAANLYKKLEGTFSKSEKNYGTPEKVHAIPERTYDEAEVLHGETEIVHGTPEIPHGKPEIVHGEPEIVHGEPEIQYGVSEIMHGEQEKFYESQTNHGEPEKLFGIPEKPYGEPEKVFGEPEKVYGTPEKVYEESETYYIEPEKIYSTERDTMETHTAEDIVTTTQPSTRAVEKKLSYIVDNGSYRKYRVEEKTPDGFIVGEYGMVSHRDGSLRGVRYTADSTINPSLIYDTLVKFLSLQ